MNYGTTQKIKRATYAPNKTYVAEKLETRIERMMAGGEVLLTDKEPIYTEEKDGVLEETDIRTDKFDKALNSVIKTHQNFETRMKQAIEAGEADEFGNPKEPKE